MWLIELGELLAYRFVLLPVAAQRITVVCQKVYVPLTSDVSVSEQKRSKHMGIVHARSDRTAKAALAPVANRTAQAKRIYMFEDKG